MQCQGGNPLVKLVRRVVADVCSLTLGSDFCTTHTLFQKDVNLLRLLHHTHQGGNPVVQLVRRVGEPSGQDGRGANTPYGLQSHDDEYSS